VENKESKSVEIYRQQKRKMKMRPAELKIKAIKMRNDLINSEIEIGSEEYIKIDREIKSLEKQFNFLVLNYKPAKRYCA